MDEEELWEEADEEYSQVLYQNKVEEAALEYRCHCPTGEKEQQPLRLVSHAAAWNFAVFPQEQYQSTLQCCHPLQGYGAHKRLKWSRVLVGGAHWAHCACPA